MDRKEWARVVEEAIDRYRQDVSAEDWPADATVEDHVVQFGQRLADVGREWLA